ncbi:unnamed protein product [Effrenium voratum]|uniref:Uncharacterized protein n=1 Tax=Effrenium voratum TaxID=2562239 RepID=A0AA36NCG0_9DINO|nr:unnamed protein product [Effrenium voratum]
MLAHVARGPCADRADLSRFGQRLPTSAARAHRWSPAAFAALFALPRLAPRASRPRVAPRRAVVQDAHAAAVGRWVEGVILGLEVCPWARPAQQGGRLRVVSSEAQSAEEVLEDLAAEAELLREESATTVLVCPHVAEWQDFGAFHRFYCEELQSGRLLSRSLGLEVFVVPFHPDCESTELAPGQQLAVTVHGVLHLAEMQSQEGEEIEVRLLGRILESQDAEDGAEDFAVEPLSEEVVASARASDVLWALDDTGSAGSGRGALGRSPRPALHLLRTADLARVEEEKRQEVQRRNEALLQDMGADALDELIRQCG